MVGLKDVAKRAGVSARTVSRVMRGETNVAPETRERIKQLCQEMGYRPNLAARGLRSKRAHEVIVVAWSSAIFNDAAEIYLTRIQGIEQRLRAMNLPIRMRIEPLHQSDAEFDELLEELATAQPIAVAAFPMRAARLATAAARLHAADVPLVGLDQSGGTDHPGLHRVTVDRAEGIKEAIHYLAGQGRKRIAYAGIDATSRVNGYRAALSELGMPAYDLFCPIVHTSPELYLEGRQMAERIAELSEPPDAVQCYADSFALGLISRAKELGIRVPDDLAVIGFDDRNTAVLCSPPLTTVALPNLELGEMAADALLAALAGKFAEHPPSIAVPTRLVIRGSA